MDMCPAAVAVAFTRRDAAPYRLLWHPVRVDWASGPAWGPSGWPAGSAAGSAWPAWTPIVCVQGLNLFLFGHFLKFGD